MNCEQARAVLHEYSEGALEERLRKQMEAHLPDCRPCRSAFERVRRLERRVGEALPLPELPATFWVAQQKSVIARAGRRPGSFWIALGGAGLAAAGLLGLGLYLLSGERAAPAQKVETAKEEKSPSVKTVERPKREFPFRVAQGDGTQAPPAPRETIPPPPSAPPRDAVGEGRLPGSPEHLALMTRESIQVGLAESASDRVQGLIGAADARLEDLRSALGARDDSMAEELAAAYTLILRKGLAVILGGRDEDARELVTARSRVKTFAGEKASVLAALEPGARGNLKSALREAVLASRELSGP